MEQLITIFLLLARYVPNVDVVKEEYMRLV